MRRNRIGMKLGLVIASIVFIVLLFLGVSLYQMFSNFYHAEMRTEVTELTSHFRTMAETTDASSMEEMIRTFADFSNVSMFYINAAGEVTLHSGGHSAADQSFIRTEDVQQIFAGESIHLEHEDPLGNRYMVIGQPLYHDNQISSAIYVMASMHSMDRSLITVRNLLLLSGVGAFLLAIGITWIMALLFSRPLIMMQQATKKIAIGELATRLDIHSKDEIGDLAAAINNLAADLQRYRDTRQEFFAAISHELRTPITYVEGYAKVVKNRLYETEEEKDRYLDIIYQEGVRIQHLVNDLFELAKMEEGKISLSMEWVDLKDVVDQAVQAVSLQAKEKEIELIVHPVASVPLIRGDGRRMEQIVRNLLENAVRYTEEGRIEVHLRSTSGTLSLSIEDTGIGIAEEELPYIFDRFYRVEKSRSRKTGGTGLGLSIVKKLVELQGGSIQVSSQREVGTRFTVTFTLPTMQEEKI
ncbi:HAMP domain-containing histidine kinase [Paenibacillus thiaminolyticus]|uniref:histidine kinase n=1 Tax=Paenibacillus thiaminolyticus TaxID=49283 RepID=A0AAP9IZU3_PANTH|nr:HAMP domain-containing sensor histidine kinase [Paenibacillus thiaminolyticus]MCY9534950.1 HAMP domain-containing histidine kinase [Paenibacillus thiaminolyticus]MCY9603919.1 HAMP domain-containing histidine kinase [Paenibacillus thiaminolyticus]MCY9606823.1 HAMP domain-containing histidine kinase [Paenibacillus thiaminolyticus]MCY9615815.1 HAMP domain-containing histidine kinase [Paenibacillus thiaminolyticus]MCY9619049.1 HAMP domain-containing histidine kinase [Paenibacillus thiaminolytic